MSLSHLVTAADKALMADVDTLAARELAFLAKEPMRDPVTVAAMAKETVRGLALTGLLKHAVGPLEGGAPSLVRLCAVRERLARHHGLADLMFAMQGLGTAPIALAGTAEQRKRWLPAAVEGRAIAALAITEPDAGSDVAALSTLAIHDQDGYRLEGKKTFISNAGIADVYVVFAKTNPAGGARGISAFIVPKETPGLKVDASMEVIAPHPIGTLTLSDCLVPHDARVGEDDHGFQIAMETLALFRPSVGAAAVGFATRALEESILRARTRQQFGAKIGTFQAIQMYLAEMATDLDAARLLVYRAARMRDDGEPHAARAAAMAKLAATENAQSIVDKAVQVHGGSGVLVGSVVERLYREVRALRIYEGTSEIQKVVIARELLGKM
jgi:acyl-CoA dehydrogenase